MLRLLADLRIYDHIQFVLLAATCLVVVGVTVMGYLLKLKTPLPLPPSPPTWRLWGHFLPLYNPFLTIEGWIDRYGPLITIRSGTEKFVIIGRHSAAMDIMEKQSASLADRPRLVAAGEILSGGLSIGFTPVGDRFRRMRRALHTHLQPKAAQDYDLLQESHGRRAVLDILDDPYNFQNHVTTFATATIMQITYGKTTPTSATGPEVSGVRQLLEAFGKALRPGAYLADSIPCLQYLPWYGRELKVVFEKSTRLFTNQLINVKQQIQSNADVGPSFMRYMLENSHLHGLTEIEMAFLGGTLFGAGTDATAMSICTVLMAASCFPEEQAKVYVELDGVIGKDRVPTIADGESLPHLNAFISEALRWRPIAAIGLAHRTTEDVIWENYCIPAGTTVFGNHWAISRDPGVYPDPHSFNPQRWINDKGCVREDPKFFVYGFGRRICPGQHIANRSVLINTLLILWAFQLSVDPTKPLDDMGFMKGVMPNDRPCAIEFKARFPEAEIKRMIQDYAEVI